MLFEVLPVGLVDNLFYMIKVSELELSHVCINFFHETMVTILGTYELRMLDWVELDAEWLGDSNILFLSQLFCPVKLVVM